MSYVNAVGGREVEPGPTVDAALAPEEVADAGTMAGAVSEGTIMDHSGEGGGGRGPSAVDLVVIPVFRGVLNIINLAKDFSPIDSLSTGRSVSWGELARAFMQVVLLMAGAFAAIGIISFTRRELATAQGTQ